MVKDLVMKTHEAKESLASCIFLVSANFLAKQINKSVCTRYDLALAESTVTGKLANANSCQN